MHQVDYKDKNLDINLEELKKQVKNNNEQQAQ